MQIRFDGEIVLVTGAASGIGRATAVAFAAAGARLVLVDRDTDRLQGVADEVAAHGAAPALLRGLDIADRDGCRALADEVMARVGPLRHLINNAGIDGKADVGSAEADALWDRVIGVNVTGAHNMIAAFVPHLLQTRAESARSCRHAKSASGPSPCR